MVVSLAVALLVGGGAVWSGADDYPIVDATIPVFGIEASARYMDDTPIVQDQIAQPWEPIVRVTGPRCACNAIAVPEGW
jgi:hypothetical protein